MPLTPYPEPSKKEEKLVHNVEVFANGLKKFLQVLNTGLTPITYFPKQHKEKREQLDWEERVAKVPYNDLKPPTQHAVHVTKSTQCMDHEFFYVLKGGRIWFKPIAAPFNSGWLLLGPDGLPPNVQKLDAITTDGRNLVAIANNTVNYVHTDRIKYAVTADSWKVFDIHLDWTDKWFAMPLVNKIVGLLHNPKLQLPEDWVSVAISQKGPETGYYTDMSGKNQPEFLVGVTTLFVMTKNGRIFFADPWLGNGFHNEITAPEDGQFVADEMRAAASTLFLIRMDGTGNAQMYTRFADFDSTGNDPLLPTSFNPHNKISLVRYIPGEDWIKQPEIPLRGKAQLTSQIDILQTGRGQSNRQLRVTGTNEVGEVGYYFKSIYEDNWYFEPTPEQKINLNHKQNTHCPPAPPVNLNGTIQAKEFLPIQSVALKKFLRHGLNERGLHTTLELTLNNGRQLSLPLFARRRFAQLFGMRNNKPYWQLLLPEGYQTDCDPEVRAVIQAFFKNKNHVSVEVNESPDGKIEISNKHRNFSYKFDMSLKNDCDSELLSRPGLKL